MPARRNRPGKYGATGEDFKNVHQRRQAEQWKLRLVGIIALAESSEPGRLHQIDWAYREQVVALIAEGYLKAIDLSPYLDDLGIPRSELAANNDPRWTRTRAYVTNKFRAEYMGARIDDPRKPT